MAWSFANPLKLSYWLAISTPTFSRGSLIIALSALILVLATAVALRVLAHKKSGNPPLARFARRAARPLFFLAILGLLLVWFRQLGAAILSARFLMALILLIALLWLVVILRAFRKTYRAELARLASEHQYRAYLPKKNK